jgi:hypothetical protein
MPVSAACQRKPCNASRRAESERDRSGRPSGFQPETFGSIVRFFGGGPAPPVVWIEWDEMRALRGDLFEITDEDPLALAADEGDQGYPFVAAPEDELDVDEPGPRVPVPTARNPERLGSRRGRWALCAALICGAAAGVATLRPLESAQRGRDNRATPDARVPDPPTRLSSLQRGRAIGARRIPVSRPRYRRWDRASWVSRAARRLDRRRLGAAQRGTDDRRRGRRGER